MSTDHEAIEPLRLLDDEAEAPSLRDALAREKAFRADYDDVDGLARFQATLGAELSKGASNDALPARAFRRLGSMLSLVALGVVVTGTVFGPRWFASKPEASSSISSMEITQPSEAEQPPTAPEIPSLAVESLPAATAPDPSNLAPRTPRSIVAPAAKPSATTSGIAFDPLEETRHLGALRRIASTDPARALGMIEDGNRRFARGSFREERDAIAVGALARLGREPEARRAGEAFLATYPTSPLSPQVRRAAGL